MARGYETNEESPGNYQIENWNTAQGLPHPSVLALAQTPDGYIWCGTEAGLVRFDGVHFTVFDSKSTPELGNGQIRSLFVDKQGTLWIATRDSRFVRFHDQTFTGYLLPKRTRLNQAILNFADDNEGGLWLMPEDQAEILRFADGQFESSDNLWLNGPAVFGIREGFDGSLWMASATELAHGDSHGKFKIVLRDQFDKCLGPSRTGGFWVSNGDHIGLWHDGVWQWQGTTPWKPTTALEWAVEDRHLRLWVASSSQGVFCLDTNNVVLHFTVSNGLASDFARFVLPDQEDNVWVATENGLSRIKPALFKVYDHHQGLKADRVTGTCPAVDGGLWVGTDGGGLHRLHDGTFSAHSNDPNLNLVTAVLLDHATNLWVGTRNGGLFESQPDGFAPVQRPPLTLEISALFEDHTGCIWVGQRCLNQVLQLSNQTCRVLTLPNPEPVVDVRCFAEDAAGGPWIGTAGNGLFHWNGEYFERFSHTNGLPSDLISTLHFDFDDHCLWVGTDGDGLARLKLGQFQVCTMRNGLWDDTICQMLDDHHGFFWFGSSRGIFRVHKADLRQFMNGETRRIQSAAYDEADGLPTLSCSGGFQPAGCRTADGKLWFPTLQGLVSIDPANVPTSPHAPVVQIEQILLDGEPIRDVPARSTTEDEETPAFKIPSGAHRCEFRYTGLSLAAPEAVQFRYRLEGLEPGWVEAGTTRSAIYSRLPPGNYRFVVTAANRDSVWNETGASLNLRVLPQFWQTGWFVSSCVIVGVVLLVGTGWSIARRRAQRRLVELTKRQSLYQERVRIAKDIHDDLGTGLTHIAWLSDLAVEDSSRPEKVQVHTQKIAEQSRRLVSSLDETVWAITPENDSLESLVRYISSYGHEQLDTVGIRCIIDMPDRLPAIALPAEVRHDLFLATKEVLTNLLKHAAAKNVHLKFSLQAESVTIRIEDDGCGFTSQEAAPPTRGGHGLQNLSWRLSRHGGKFICESAAGQGTRIELWLPLNH